jgi:hypothetical protein
MGQTVNRALSGRQPITKGETMSANDTQIGGDHYTSKAIQPWEAMEAWMSKEAFEGFLTGNSLKYLARWKDKGGVDDLRKAKHYIEKLIELETQVKDESKTIHGFIPWTGGAMPVDGEAMVEVLMGNQTTEKANAHYFVWGHDEHKDSNIIGYRVIK